MIDQLIALIIDESKWLTTSLSLALLSVLALTFMHRNSDLPRRVRILAAMNLFFGVTIGTMAFGHLLAVTIKLAMRTLEGSDRYRAGATLLVADLSHSPNTVFKGCPFASSAVSQRLAGDYAPGSGYS